MFPTACSALCTVSLSLLTAALAEARFASRVAALCLVVVESVGDEVVVASVACEPSVEPPELEPCFVAPELLSDFVWVVVGPVVAGEVLVCGVVEVEVPVPASGVWLPGSPVVVGV